MDIRTDLGFFNLWLSGCPFGTIFWLKSTALYTLCLLYEVHVSRVPTLLQRSYLWPLNTLHSAGVSPLKVGCSDLQGHNKSSAHFLSDTYLSRSEVFHRRRYCKKIACAALGVGQF